MAITATVSVSPSAVQFNQKVGLTVTVANDGASAVTVQGIKPFAYLTGGTKAPYTSVAYGTPNLSAGATTSVAASGSTTFPLDLVFFTPSTGILSTGSDTFDVTAFVTCSDGSYVSATPTQVSVDYFAFPESQQ